MEKLGYKKVKIIVLPGVGLHLEESRKVHKKFTDKISSGLSCECEMYYWEHGWQIPNTNLPYKSIRKFVAEVILDFQKIVRDALSMKVPDADIYIGHSAGSILGLIQMKPSIIFGSPALLAEILRKEDINVDMFNVVSKIKNMSFPILNIINKNDFIAYPLEWNNVENFYLYPSLLNPIKQFPGNAHNSYWEDDRVVKKIIKTIKNWNDKNLYNIEKENCHV